MGAFKCPTARPKKIVQFNPSSAISIIIDNLHYISTLILCQVFMTFYDVFIVFKIKLKGLINLLFYLKY